MGTLLPIKSVPGWGKSHKGRGPPRCAPPAGAAKNYFQGLSTLRLELEEASSEVPFISLLTFKL